jgi:hypothetical protein
VFSFEIDEMRSVFVEMVVNKKTAKALGLALSQSIVMRADELIE